MENPSESFYLTEDQLKVENGFITIKMPAPHSQVLPYYPIYRTDKPSNIAVEDYRKAENCCGHTQRSWLLYFSVKAFIETGLCGIDLGSAGVSMLGAIATDILGNGDRPEYGGSVSGVQIKMDGCDLSIFQTASLSCVISNHFLEHAYCRKLKGGETVSQKIQLNCDATELIDVFRNHWLRVLVPGGYFCAVFPEENAANRGGHSVFHQDPQHQHALRSDRFRVDVIQPLVNQGLVEVVEYDTFQNNFSCNLAMRKL